MSEKITKSEDDWKKQRLPAATIVLAFAMIATAKEFRSSWRRRLRRLGCGVALDDFGAGLSSLSCLRQLPVTMLKIDGSFVRDVLRDARAESMVRAIAQLARSMSIISVAEYIETEAIGTRIAELGVDYGQGFAIGRPIPLADLLTELTLSNAPDESGEDGTACYGRAAR